MYKEFVDNFIKARDIAPTPWLNEDRIRTAKLISFFKKIKNKKVLDIGCDQGNFSKFLQSCNNIVYALDIENKKNYFTKTKIKFIQHDANKKLPFPNNFFDVVIASETLEHIKNVDFVLSEINRVLKRNGILLCDVPTAGLNFFADLINLFYPFYASLRKLIIDINKINKRKIAIYIRNRFKKGKLGLLKYPLIIETWFNMAHYGAKYHFHKHHYIWWLNKIKNNNFLITDCIAAGILFPFLSFLPEKIQNKFLIIDFLIGKKAIIKFISYCIIFKAVKI